MSKYPIEYKGLPVPYVSIWSSEETAESSQIFVDSYTGGLGYPDERPSDRDRFGIPWLHMPITPGVGVPELGRMHAYRQRNCMLRNRCQVCNRHLMMSEALWTVLGNVPREPVSGDWLNTPMPPFCEGCYVITKRFCPYFLSGGRIVFKGEFSVEWGVVGEEFDLTEGKAVSLGPKTYTYNEIDGRPFVAKQQVMSVAFTERIA